LLQISPALKAGRKAAFLPQGGFYKQLKGVFPRKASLRSIASGEAAPKAFMATQKCGAGPKLGW
jgi:hypothetical protein